MAADEQFSSPASSANTRVIEADATLITASNIEAPLSPTADSVLQMQRRDDNNSTFTRTDDTTTKGSSSDGNNSTPKNSNSKTSHENNNNSTYYVLSPDEDDMQLEEADTVGSTPASSPSTIVDDSSIMGHGTRDAYGHLTGEEGERASGGHTHGEEHLSRKYTKGELMARHWGMSIEQMKRVKALLRLGVNEEDLVIADRLLKLGSDPSDDTPWTKEEQLLGYTSTQRQRMKALHTLGLTEESFERCRAIMLSSLGPSAFGFDVDTTALSAARAAEEEGWTPADKTRKKGHHTSTTAGGVQGLLRITSFSHQHGVHENHLAHVGGGMKSLKYLGGGAGGSKGVRRTLPHRDTWRRASDPQEEVRLPNIQAGRTRAVAQKAGGGKERVQPTESDGTSRAGRPLMPLSTRTDPG